MKHFGNTLLIGRAACIDSCLIPSFHEIESYHPPSPATLMSILYSTQPRPRLAYSIPHPFAYSLPHQFLTSAVSYPQYHPSPPLLPIQPPSHFVFVFVIVAVAFAIMFIIVLGVVVVVVIVGVFVICSGLFAMVVTAMC